MAQRVRVKVRRAGVRAMLGQPYMVADIGRRVERMKRYGILRSPYLTGQYSRSWFAIAGLRRGVAYGRVGNAAPHAWFVERGTRNPDGTVRMRARHVVQETIQVAGD